MSPNKKLSVCGDKPKKQAFVWRIKQPLDYTTPTTINEKRASARETRAYVEPADKHFRDNLHGDEENQPVIVQVRSTDVDAEDDEVNAIEERENDENEVVAPAVEPPTTAFNGTCDARPPPRPRAKKSTDNFVKLNYKNKSYSRAPKKMTGSQLKRLQYRMRMKNNK